MTNLSLTEICVGAVVVFSIVYVGFAFVILDPLWVVSTPKDGRILFLLIFLSVWGAWATYPRMPRH